MGSRSRQKPLPRERKESGKLSDEIRAVRERRGNGTRVKVSLSELDSWSTRAASLEEKVKE